MKQTGFGNRIRANGMAVIVSVWAVIFLVIVFLADWDSINSYTAYNTASLSYVKARVVSVDSQNLDKDDTDGSRYLGTQSIQVEILEGEFQGERVSIENYLTRTQNIYVKESDLIIVCADHPRQADAIFTVFQYYRVPVLWLILAAFAALVLLVGRGKGIRALLGLGFTVGAVLLFMVLNSNNSSAAEHKAFMESAIAACPDATWKVVAYHHSVYSVASHAVDTDILTLRERLAPVLSDLDVDVVLQGHDHVYVRSWMMGGASGQTVLDTDTLAAPAEYTNPEGVLYVTLNSASGSKYYNIKSTVYEYSAVQNQEYTPNYSIVNVSDESFTITTYRTADQSVVDAVTIGPAESTEGDSEGSITDGDAAETGDMANLSLWIFLLVLSGCAVTAGVLFTEKKARR